METKTPRRRIRRKPQESQVEKMVQASAAALVDEETKALRDQVSMLTADLQIARSDLDSAQSDVSYYRNKYESADAALRQMRQSNSTQSVQASDAVNKVIGFMVDAFKQGAISGEDLFDEDGEIDDVLLDLAQGRYRTQLTRDRNFKERVKKVAVALAQQLGINTAESVEGDWDGEG